METESLFSLTIWPNPVPLTLRLLPYFFIAFLAESMLYGIHFVIFCVCVRILLPRRRMIQRMMLGAVVVMFVLATIDIAVSWRLLFRRTYILYQTDSDEFLRAVYAKVIIHLINNVIADTLLIIRCYVVWGRRKIILYVAGPLLLGVILLGFISESTSSKSLKRLIALYTLAAVAWNLMVTSLTAARILWVSRRVRQIIGPKMVPHYHFAVGILVESGLIYTVSTLLIVFLAKTPYIILGAGISIRMVGIMPVLLIVQIALGKSTQDVQKTVTRIQGDTQQIVLDTIITTGFDPEEATTYRRSVDATILPADPKSLSSLDMAPSGTKS